MVLLHYHVFSASPHSRHEAPAVAGARNELLRLGAIVPCVNHGGSFMECPYSPDHETFITTTLGKSWVAALCATPMPVASEQSEVKMVTWNIVTHLKYVCGSVTAASNAPLREVLSKYAAKCGAPSGAVFMESGYTATIA